MGSGSSSLSGLSRIRILLVNDKIHVGLTGTGPFEGVSHTFSRVRTASTVLGGEVSPSVEDYQFFASITAKSSEAEESSSDSESDN